MHRVRVVVTGRLQFDDIRQIFNYCLYLSKGFWRKIWVIVEDPQRPPGVQWLCDRKISQAVTRPHLSDQFLNLFPASVAIRGAEQASPDASLISKRLSTFCPFGERDSTFDLRRVALRSVAA